ncbi:MAG: hypothetical protein ACAI25_02045 [Planctomycetota bacterium]
MGKPGGRGRKGVYFVAPATLERFLLAKAQLERARPEEAALGVSRETVPHKTVMAPGETVNGPTQTVNLPGEERNLSHHRSLRLLEKKRTSDVSSFEDHERPHERSHERPTIEAVWAWAQSARSGRIKVRLLRLLETLLVIEALARETVMAPPETGPHETGSQESGPQKTVMPPPETVHAAEHRGAPEACPELRRRGRAPSEKKRVLRAASPLWSGERGEEAQVLAHARSILEWANREHGARFDIAKVSRDTLLYPFERVRSAVANVLLKKARGYAIKNAGAVLWDGITLEGYKFEEFSVACFDEVLARLGRCRPGEPPDSRAARVVATLPAPPSPARAFEPERQRRALLQALYEKLPGEQREEIDRRAEILAREDLGPGASELRLGLLKVDKKNELLAALPDAIADAGESQTGRQESQISHIGSVRDETEPNQLPATRT